MKTVVRRLLVLITLVSCISVAVSAQEADAPEGTRIVSAQISGLDNDQLSPNLRREISELVGKPLNWSEVGDLAGRIESERPGVVAAVRAVQTPDAGAKVVIFIARISGDQRLEENINARYTIESVAIEGVPEGDVSQELRTELRALVGGDVDHAVLERFADRLRVELRGYEVERKMRRGSRRGRLRLIYEVHKGETSRLLHFAPSTSKFIYHSSQGWSGLLDLRLGNRDFRVTPLFAFGNGDDLIEEYSGYGVRMESRNVGTDRLGISLQLSSFDQTWEGSTLAALASNPSIPEAYRTRSTVEPMISFAVNPHLHVSGGFSVSEMESLSRSPATQMANSLVASIGYEQTWRQGESRRTAQAILTVRSASTTLQSDLDYTRYLIGANHQFQWGDSTALASVTAGRITGQAPLFERFSLGDSSTLRGWDKYDIAPAGGDRMFGASLEYRNHGLALFLDAGSVWDRQTPSRLRTSAGFGYHRENVFLTFGFPLNTKDVDGTVALGVRF